MKKLIVILILLLLALGAAVWSLKFSGVTHEDIYEAAASLYRALAPAGGIRLLGISAQNFGAAEELSLFDAERPQKKENLYRAIDGLKQRFGENIIGHGHT